MSSCALLKLGCTMEPQSNCAVFSFSACQLRLQVGPWEPDVRTERHSPSGCVPRGNRWIDWRLTGLRGRREEGSPHIHPTPWTALRPGSPLFSSRIGAILAPFMWALIPFSSTQAPLGISFLAQTFTMFFFFFPHLVLPDTEGFWFFKVYFKALERETSCREAK